MFEFRPLKTVPAKILAHLDLSLLIDMVLKGENGIKIGFFQKGPVELLKVCKNMQKMTFLLFQVSMGNEVRKMTERAWRVFLLLMSTFTVPIHKDMGPFVCQNDQNRQKKWWGSYLVFRPISELCFFMVE